MPSGAGRSSANANDPSAEFFTELAANHSRAALTTLLASPPCSVLAGCQNPQKKPVALITDDDTGDVDISPRGAEPGRRQQITP